MPAHPLVRKNECATAAEEAARVAFACGVFSRGPNAQGKRRRSTEGAEGINTGHENAEGMACVGVRLTAQLGAGFLALALRFILEFSRHHWLSPSTHTRRAELHSSRTALSPWYTGPL